MFMYYWFIIVHSFVIYSGAPTPLSESELIGLMDSEMIGTDATIAEHIKKVITLIHSIKSFLIIIIINPLFN